MMPQIAATMLRPMSDKQRAETHCGGNRKEGLEASKGPEEMMKNKMTLYICMQSGNVDGPVYAGSTRISLRCSDMKAMCVKSKSDSEF